LFQDRHKEGEGGSREWPSELPLLPLRNVVAFPYTLLPLSVGQPRSLRLLKDVLDGDHLLVLAAMKDPSVAEPGPEGIYETGVIAHIERASGLDDDEGYQIVVRSTCSPPICGLR
jgi:ATP-dependent Lon protease